MTPLLPLVLLAAGALAVLAGLLPNFRLTGLTAAGATALALLVTLVMGFGLPRTMVVSAWQPVSLFPGGLQLAINGLEWLFALALLLALLAVFLTSIARRGGARVRARSLSLLFVAAALAAIFADSLVTLAIAWAGLDLLFYLTLAFLASETELNENATITMALNMLSTVLIVAAALVAGTQSATALFSGETLPAGALALAIGAGALRLGIFPFHTALPSEPRIGIGVGTLLRLATAAVAFELLAQLAASPDVATLPYANLLTLVAILGVVFGAFQWFLSPYPPAGLPYVVLVYSSLGLLVLLWGGSAAPVGLTALGVALLTGGAVLFLSNHAETGIWRVPVYVAVGVLAALPLTVGFAGLWALTGGIAAAGLWGWLALLVVVIGLTLFAATGLRLVHFDLIDEPLPESERGVRIAYAIGVSVPLLMPLGFGALPVAIEALIGAGPDSLPPLGPLPVVISLLPLALGFTLWYFEGVIRGSADWLWDRLAYASQLDWLYKTLLDVYRGIGRVLDTMAGIIEGQGGVLWTLVLAIMAWLVISGA